MNPSLPAPLPLLLLLQRPSRNRAGMLFKGFDIPLQELSGEKFEQPILFGANNLSGIVQTNVAYAGGFFRPFRALTLLCAQYVFFCLYV